MASQPIGAIAMVISQTQIRMNCQRGSSFNASITLLCSTYVFSLVLQGVEPESLEPLERSGFSSFGNCPGSGAQNSAFFVGKKKPHWAGLGWGDGDCNAYFYMYNFPMKFTWHEPKRAENIAKHGYDFADGEKVFSGPTITVEDVRQQDEQRFNTTGFLEVDIVTICHTETEEEIHFISMRKAEPHEIQILARYL